MHLKLYEKFLKKDFELIIEARQDDFIKSGTLVARDSKLRVPIKEYIPRFCKDDYCESFSLQWLKFSDLQLDSKNGHTHSYLRLIKSSKWDLSDLKGKSILECGCGPGRFTEIFLKAGATVVSVDMSKAVDANFNNNGPKDNLLLLQADISELKFFKNKFDYVFSYGVLQHTPNPENTFNSLLEYVRPGGRISIDTYRTLYIPTWWTLPKYLWRPLTKGMGKEKLLKIIEWYIPKYIDFDTFLKRIPKLGIILTGLIPIPCWNYINMGYTRDERIKHAIMDTFDALSPVYDKPKTLRQVRKWFEESSVCSDIDVFSGGNGVIGNAFKK